jgi:hypothetical protein
MTNKTDKIDKIAKMNKTDETDPGADKTTILKRMKGQDG